MISCVMRPQTTRGTRRFPQVLLKKFALQNLADEQWRQLVAAVVTTRTKAKRVLFGEYLDEDFAKPPVYGGGDGNFVFDSRVAQGERVTEAVCAVWKSN